MLHKTLNQPPPTVKIVAAALQSVVSLPMLIVGSLIMFDWASLGLAPATAATIASGFLLADKVIKFSMNIFRDGIGGLFKVQPPVLK